MEKVIDYAELDLKGALKETQTDCDICFNAIYNGGKSETSLIYWKKRYNRMADVANALRKIISHDDPRFSKPYTFRRFSIREQA